MIHLTDRIWLGNSDDARRPSARGGPKSKLNVAADLIPSQRSPNVEVAHVGLVDGPGNRVSDYCAAVLTVASLLDRHDSILVYDHDGGRSLVVCLMYLTVVVGRRSGGVSMPHCWPGWKSVYDEVCGELPDLPEVHKAHIEAFETLPFGILEVLIH